jgi:hypothetical protein
MRLPSGSHARSLAAADRSRLLVLTKAVPYRRSYAGQPHWPHRAWFERPINSSHAKTGVRSFFGAAAAASLEPDTIYALSTAPGRAAIAIVRISGPACLDVGKGNI